MHLFIYSISHLFILYLFINLLLIIHFFPLLFIILFFYYSLFYLFIIHYFISLLFIILFLYYHLLFPYLSLIISSSIIYYVFIYFRWHLHTPMTTAKWRRTGCRWSHKMWRSVCRTPPPPWTLSDQRRNGNQLLSLSLSSAISVAAYR